jgi:hypothetical protein
LVFTTDLIEVPPPHQLGIHLDDAPAVVVPEPGKLGIKLD